MDQAETDEQGRSEPPLAGDEAATLVGFLDFQRATLGWRCRGLSDEQLRMALPPTAMTLGGMLKHLAFVEGVRPPQRSRRPDPRADRRPDRRMTKP